MKTFKGLKYMLALASLGVVAALSQGAASAQTTANGPYYATPSWDQQLPAATRFIVLANWGSAAVLDRETGLVWERSPGTFTLPWLNASIHCIGLNAGGRKGWRLPTIQDLSSLVDPTQNNPALPNGHPFTIQSSAYWSATTFGFNTSLAFLMNFGSLEVGGSAPVGSKSNENFAWCVRGGQGVDPQ